MNWGYKILVVYIVFIGGIVTLVYKSSVQKQELVVNDYYDQELKYQDKIDAIVRTNNLKSPVQCNIEKDAILINFPAEMKGLLLKASILLYCPVDKKKDIQKQLSTNDAIVRFPLVAGNKGLHKLKINWTVNDTSFYSEKQIMIP